MIPRYSRAEMQAIWSEENRFRLWQEVEIAVCEARAALGQIPADEAQLIRSRSHVEAARVHERERQTNHDVAAFVDVMSDSICEASRHVHFGMTSSDVLDTALAMQLRDSGKLLLQGLEALIQTLRQRAVEHKHTPMVGRTHGIHAEPMTFGLKVLHWYSEAQRSRLRLERAVQEVSFGKVSGAVGTFPHLGPEVESRVCAQLGLQPEPVATQVVPRDRHAFFLAALAGVGACLERIGTEVRHLQRTEVREAEEPFGEKQKGSSSMPHKRNPIRSERLVGLSRHLRSHLIPAFENISLWHERDISHSSVERIMLPDACLAADYALELATRMLKDLVVYPQRMKANMESTGGAVFSQTLFLEIVARGSLRNDAYRLVQKISHEAWDSARPLLDVALESSELRSQLDEAAIQRCFDLDHNLRHVDDIFQRVLESVPT